MPSPCSSSHTSAVPTSDPETVQRSPSGPRSSYDVKTAPGNHDGPAVRVAGGGADALRVGHDEDLVDDVDQVPPGGVVDGHPETPLPGRPVCGRSGSAITCTRLVRRHVGGVCASSTPRPPTSGRRWPANLTDHVVENADAYGAEIGFRRRVGDGWQDVSWAEFLADVTAARQGPRVGGRRGRGPGRADLQDPLRVGGPRLRDLVRGRRIGPRLRDLVGRADRVDPRGLGGDGRRSRRRSTTSRGSTRAPTALPTLRRVVCIDSGGLEELVEAGSAVADTRHRGAARVSRPRTAWPP